MRVINFINKNNVENLINNVLNNVSRETKYEKHRFCIFYENRNAPKNTSKYK